MRRIVDRRRARRFLHAVGEQIVEAFSAARLLQPVDAAVAAVVEHDDHELRAEHHRRCDFRVEHQVAAVADQHDDLALWIRHLDADAAGDLVAHARVAVFDVVGAGTRGAPELVQFARQRSGGADDDVVRRRVRMRALHCADHFALVRQRRRSDFAAADDCGDGFAPRLRGGDGAFLPLARRRPAGAAPRERVERRGGIGRNRDRTSLQRVVRVDIDSEDCRLREERMRSGGEVGEPRTERDHDIGVTGERIRRSRPGHADRARVQRVIPRQCALACLRFGDRHAMCFDEALERLRSAVAVEDAATGDDERPFRGLQQYDGVFEIGLLGHRRANAPQPRREKRLGIVVRTRLHVLRQRERHRSALRRIREHGKRARQCAQKRGRMDDAIEIARHGPQAIVRRDAAVAEIPRPAAAPDQGRARRRCRRAGTTPAAD